MQGETSTAPVRPPPGPGPRPPLLSVFGPSFSPQQALESQVSGDSSNDSASSKVTIRRPRCLNPRDRRMRGTLFLSHLLALTRPPGRPSLHGSLCPSLHIVGISIEKF